MGLPETETYNPRHKTLSCRAEAGFSMGRYLNQAPSFGSPPPKENIKGGGGGPS